MEFYISTGLSFLVAVLIAFVTYKSTNTKNAKRALTGLALIGAVIAFVTNYKANNDTIRFQDTLHKRDIKINGLLNKNLSSALKIIDSLDTAVHHTRNLITQNNGILQTQKASIFLLNSGLKQTVLLQTSVKNSSRRLKTTIDTAVKNLNENILGGEIIPDISPSIPASRFNEVDLDLVNDANYPAYDVSVTLINESNFIDRLAQIPIEQRYDIMQSATKTQLEGTIRKKSGIMSFIRFKLLPEIKIMQISLYVSSRSGGYNAYIIFERVDEKSFKIKKFHSDRKNPLMKDIN